MKMKVLMGISSLLLMDANDVIVNNLEPEKMKISNNLIRSVKSLGQDKIIMKSFFEEIRYTNIITSLSTYSLKKSRIIKDMVNNSYGVIYTMENDFKKIDLLFPIIYKNGIEKIMPIYFDPSKDKLVTYKISREIKPLKEERIKELFPKEKIIVLNNPKDVEKEIIIFLESENVTSMGFLRDLFKDNMVSMKSEYKKTKVSLIVIPFNYYGEKNSLGISALLKEYNDIYGNIDIYIDYISKRKEIMAKIKGKYLKIFKESYAGDFVLAMYKEIHTKMEILSDNFLIKIIKEVELETNKDLENLIKEEQVFVESLMKLDFIDKSSSVFYRYNKEDDFVLQNNEN